jgi:hypothetical protein
VAGSCVYGNKASGSVNYWDIVEYLNDCQLLNKDYALWR